MPSVPEEAQALLQSIVDTVREPLMVLDSEAHVILASRAFYQTFNVAEAETQSRFLFELGDGQWDIPELRRLISEVLPKETVLRDYEVSHDFPSLGPRTFLLNARKLYRPGNHSEMTLLSFEDVTVRRETERVRIEALDYAQSIVETVREPLLILNEDLRVASANRAFYSTFKVSPEATMGRKIFDLGDGQWNIPKLRALLDAVVLSDTPFSDFAVSHDFPGLGYKTMLLNARKLYRPGNHATQLLLAIEDVTALQNANERERLLFDNSRDFAFLLLDKNGVIQEWKGGAEAITGWSETEVIGQVCDLIFTPEDLAHNRPAIELQEARETGRAEDRRWHVKKNGSNFFGDGVMMALRDENQNLRGYAKVLCDGTARKTAEDNLQAAYARERNIAEVLQAPLTRPIPPHAFPGLEVVTLYESALDEAEVGGDFFDAFPLAQVTVALAVADASGKGLAAAVRAMQVKEVLQAFAQEYPDSPTRIVERLNVFLCDETRAPFILEDTFDTGFVCLALAILNPDTGAGAILSAGCEPPLLLRASGQTEALDAAGLPLGVLVPQAYQALPLHMERGDLLLMATDGITEARTGKAFLGYDGFIELAKKGRFRFGDDLNAVGRFILEGARTFGSGSLRDDACLLLARRR